MELIDDNTNGYYKADSNIRQVKIVIKHGIMKVFNTENKWFFDINDKSIFGEMDDYILLVTDEENKAIIRFEKYEMFKIIDISASWSVLESAKGRYMFSNETMQEYFDINEVNINATRQ